MSGRHLKYIHVCQCLNEKQNVSHEIAILRRGIDFSMLKNKMKYHQSRFMVSAAVLGLSVGLPSIAAAQDADNGSGDDVD